MVTFVPRVTTYILALFPSKVQLLISTEVPSNVGESPVSNAVISAVLK